jgi:hypothetical protein
VRHVLRELFRFVIVEHNVNVPCYQFVLLVTAHLLSVTDLNRVVL